MAQLEEQFAIPDIKELKKQGSGLNHNSSYEYNDYNNHDNNDVLLPENEDYDNYNDNNDNNNGDYNKYLPNEEEHDMRIFSEIQAAREKEFLELFCERLSGYPEEIAISIIDELAERLREKVFHNF